VVKYALKHLLYVVGLMQKYRYQHQLLTIVAASGPTIWTGITAL